MFEYINIQIKPDLAFWGGGTVASNIDSVSEQQIVNTMNKMTKLVKDQQFTKIYFTLGAHDTYPYASYNSSGQSSVIS